LAKDFDLLYRDSVSVISVLDATEKANLELWMVAFALPPIVQSRGEGAEARNETLAPGVWPFALRPAISAQGVAPRWAKLPAIDELGMRPQESARGYVERLCDSQLAETCHYAVPELQSELVDSLAVKYLASRARDAIAACANCAQSPNWQATLTGWSRVEAEVVANLARLEIQALPTNWPVAGAAAVEISGTKSTVALQSLTDWEFEGHRLSIEQLAKRDDELAVFVHPRSPVAWLTEFRDQVRRHNIKTFLVLARLPTYPWHLLAYRVGTGTAGVSISVRAKDPIQSMLREMDLSLHPTRPNPLFVLGL
jgi:hypothetical protein